MEKNSDPGSATLISEPALDLLWSRQRHLIQIYIFLNVPTECTKVVTCMIVMPCVAAAAGAPRGGGGGAVCSCCARCSGGHLPPPGHPGRRRGGLATARLRLLSGMYHLD
jgi:hypothetical protein